MIIYPGDIYFLWGSRYATASTEIQKSSTFVQNQLVKKPILNRPDIEVKFEKKLKGLFRILRVFRLFKMLIRLWGRY